MAKAAVMDEEIDQLMRETSEYKIIGKEAETACFKIYHGDYAREIREGAKIKVIQSNLRMALKLAMDYHRMTGMPVSDFYADGKLGLLDAFYRYDWQTGVKFASYAIWYMRTRMSSTVNEHDLIRVPVRLRKKVLKALKEGKPVDWIRYGKEAESAIMHTFSMDTPVESCDDFDGDITVGDTIPDASTEDTPVDHEHEAELVRQQLEHELKTQLTPEESTLIRHLYGLGGEEYSLDDVAAETGSSKDWARRVKTRALEKLRDGSRLNRLRTEV